jgi:hypothetical protein
VEDFDDTPDRRFWTAYDHFMFEREVREMRRREVYAMFGRASQALLQRARLAAAGIVQGSRRTRTSGA